MAYTKVHDPWHNANLATGGGDVSTPLTAAKLDTIEAGIFNAAAVADAAIPKAISGYATDKVPVYDGASWVAQKIVNAQIDDAAAIARSKIAVENYATTLPGSPVNGQTTILVDSLTAPSYQWRFRYNSSGGTYKWEFVGGSELYNGVEMTEPTTSTAYTDLATVGPTLTVPRAGVYLVKFGAQVVGNSVIRISVSYSIGAVAASDTDATSTVAAGGADAEQHTYRQKSKTLAASDALTMKYRTNAGSASFSFRSLSVVPVRVS